ncbi:ribosomal protein RPL5 [Babesia ovis]|uniref:Ribosomal protein RPL5 n=1 Tax=Babesia ovis TaxID=5869 RepID=A0A9W5TC70_BABOV|nr:ribosomal protein RPL5 [Babesia ovis]
MTDAVDANLRQTPAPHFDERDSNPLELTRSPIIPLHPQTQICCTQTESLSGYTADLKEQWRSSACSRPRPTSSGTRSKTAGAERVKPTTTVVGVWSSRTRTNTPLPSTDLSSGSPTSASFARSSPPLSSVTRYMHPLIPLSSSTMVSRLLAQLKLDNQFVGKEKPDGTVFHIEEEDHERRPFKALLDVGIKIVTTGNKVFGALKGACDGGLHIPHSEKRFPGFTVSDDKQTNYDAEAHRERIMGIHVANYMREMKEEDPEKYKKHFSAFLKAGVNEDNIEAMYTQAHAAIRKNPIVPKTKKPAPTRIIKGHTVTTSDGKKYIRNKKITKAQRMERVRQKMLMCAQGEV